MKERSLVLIKPDAVIDGRGEEIITFIKEKGAKVVLTKMIECSPNRLKLLYPHVTLSDSISTMLENFKNGPAILVIFEGLNATIIGIEAKRFFRERYYYGYYGSTIHASDNQKEFEREFNILLEKP